MRAILSFFADSFMQDASNEFKLGKDDLSKLNFLQHGVQRSYEALKARISDKSTEELLDQLKDCLRSEEFEYGKIKFCEGFRMGMLLMLEINGFRDEAAHRPFE